MLDLGYNFTIDKIAKQLVSIGAFINIGNSFPLLYLLSLVIGMGILNARTNTAAMLAQREQGAIYWECYKVNYLGKGGIMLTRVIDQKTAEGIIKANIPEPNVFAYDMGAAAYVATQAGTNLGIQPHSPHNAEKQPLNLPHFHIYVAPGITGNTHSFYWPM